MMDRYPFIFSNERKYRLRRHLAFWLAWFVSQAFLYSFVAGTLHTPYSVRLQAAFLDSVIFLIPHMFLSYSLMYFAIPRFLLKQKYWQAAFWLAILCLCTTVISTGLSLTIVRGIKENVFGFDVPQARNSSWMALCLSLMAGLRGGLSVAGMAAAIKLMKYWYVKEQRNLQLQKENVAAQLQLLKAQVHPHFLFNTLNNIYSYTQKVSPTGSKLVMGLSDLLRYILHEGSRTSVPLSGELKMIDDYILLEQIRYGNRLEINKEIPADTKNLLVAPLLLLPFVENCFKHGASQMLEQAWIRLAIDIEGTNLKMTLINAKAPPREDVYTQLSGIGIMNVRKRLELLYPGKHELVITEEEDVFIVKLRVELEKDTVVKRVKETKELLHHA